MRAPKHIDFTPEQVEDLIDRLNNQSLRKEDYPILADLLKAIVWMNFSLQEKQLSIQRLRSIFGIKTESAKSLANFINKQSKDKPDLSNEKDKSESNSEKDKLDSISEQKDSEPNLEDTEKEKGKHGHRPASDYTEAKVIDIAHSSLKKGNICPFCGKGKLFNLASGTVIRIVGHPWLQVEIYRPERLRCSTCGKIFTASLPQEVMESRSDSTAKAIVSLLKYRGGIPFYRQGQLQEILGTPISASEIWEMTEDVADALQPIYVAMCEKASTADLLQNDDTKARVLSIMEERKKKKDTEEKDKRSGIFTTGILATINDIKIALFFTGVKYAGENLDELLNDRPNELSTPIQQCDGGHNIPNNHDTHLSYCNAHCRRKFYELAHIWPKIVIKIIGWFSSVFANDKFAPPDPLLRLKWHQERSSPIMEQIKQYCDALIEQKEVEPNSSMGKAIAYLNNHWEGLTLFLRMPGVPLTNNDTERLLKRSVLNRKNAYFYRNETGAKIGDILMSVIETCVLNDANPWDYLIAIQKFQKDVRKNPDIWLPWIYKKRLTHLQSPEQVEALQK